MQPHEYARKVVRDLAWAISQPSMVQVAVDRSHAGGAPHTTARLLSLSRPWLAELDATPQPMLAWLSRRRRISRALSYFSALLEFWLTFCPFGAPVSQLCEGMLLEKTRCTNCERPAAPGLNSGIRPWLTCCRNCAIKKNRGPAHTAQCDFRKNSGIGMGTAAEPGTREDGHRAKWSAEELLGHRSGVVKVPLRRVIEGQPLGSNATRRSIKLGQLSLVARLDLPDGSATTIHIEPAVTFAADVSSLMQPQPR
jgi:hypothetical protein